MTGFLKKFIENENDRKAINISLIFLIIGFIIIVSYKYFIGTTSDNVILILLLIPLLIFLAVSGRLKELKGPGFVAKLSEVANEPIKIASQNVEVSENDLHIVEKQSYQFIEQKKRQITESKPIILTATLGAEGEGYKHLPSGVAAYYGRPAFLRYIEILSKFRNFKYVVFLDREKLFVAYFTAQSIKEILSDNSLGMKLIDAINQDNRHVLFEFPEIITEIILQTTSNAEALTKMEKNNLDAIIVIDENRYLKGLVTRDQIINKMILALATK